MLAWHSRGADRCRKPKSSESSYAQIGYSYSDSTSLPIPPPPPLDDGEDDGDDDGDEKGDNDSDSSHSEQVDEEELLEREGRKYGIRGFCDLRRRDEADAPTADDAPERSSRSDRRRERPRHKHQSTDESYELLTARGSESKGALPTDADCMDWADWIAWIGRIGLDGSSWRRDRRASPTYEAYESSGPRRRSSRSHSPTRHTDGEAVEITEMVISSSPREHDRDYDGRDTDSSAASYASYAPNTPPRISTPASAVDSLTFLSLQSRSLASCCTVVS